MRIPPKKPSINNFALKVVAILFAVFLWFYVDVQQNPMAETTLAVPISYLDLEDVFSVSGKIPTVNITVKGRRNTIDGLKSGDFTAVVDLSQVSLGSNRLPVKVKSPLNVTLSNINPSRVVLDIDEMGEKTMVVHTKVLGNTAKGYTYFNPSVKPTTVVITGGKKILENIQTAVVDIDASGASSNLILNLPVKLMANDDIIIDEESIGVIPNTVEVFLPIDRETPSKWVAVQPSMSGSPAEGYSISRVVTEPERIKIIGEFAAINAISEIATTAVEVEGINGDVVREVSLRLPEGVSIVGENTIKVLVSVTESDVLRTVDLPIAIRNLPEGYQGQLSSEIIQMTIKGRKELIDDENQLSQITVYVDLDGLDIGSHIVELQLENHSELSVTQILPTNVTVNLIDDTAAVDGDNIEVDSTISKQALLAD